MAGKIDYEQSLFGDDTAPITAHNTMLPPDPAVATRMPVTIDNLMAYAGNPRTTENPEYDAIKESIRHRGLDHPPNVTRQSPDQPYMIKDGGNTRLQALKELWEETQDPRFFTIDCMFHPWTSERDVLLAHIIENEMRGRMTFIDRARAAMRLKSDLEREMGESLSVRALADAITKLGWTLQNQNLSTMIYAYDVLLPWLPQALDAGMGRPAITSVKRMLGVCKQYWDSVADPSEGAFDEIWQTIFIELDDDGAFSADIAQKRLEEAMADKLNISTSSVRAEVQALESGSSQSAQRPAAQADFAPIQPEPSAPMMRPVEAVNKPLEPASKPAPSMPSGHEYEQGNVASTPTALSPSLAGMVSSPITSDTNTGFAPSIQPIYSEPGELELYQRDYTMGGFDEAFLLQRQRLIHCAQELFAVFGWPPETVIADYTDNEVYCLRVNAQHLMTIGVEDLTRILPVVVCLDSFRVLDKLCGNSIYDYAIGPDYPLIEPMFKSAQGFLTDYKLTISFGLSLKLAGSSVTPFDFLSFETITSFADRATRWNEEFTKYTALILNESSSLLTRGEQE